MLILTREKGETLKITDNIIITVMDVRGRSARLGIDAPREVEVNREEVFYQSLNEKTNQQAS